MKEKSVIELAWELIKRPPLALIVIGVGLVLFSAVGRYAGYEITDRYWRMGVAALGLFLTAAGLLFLRKERFPVDGANLQPSPKPSPAQRQLPQEASDLLTTDRETKSSREIATLAQNYVEEIRRALEPNDLDDFLAQKRLPSVSRHLEWWEKAISIGQGPHALPVTFLEKQKAVRLLTLSSQLSDRETSSELLTRITGLATEIYSQSDTFCMLDVDGQREYRLAHLRDHIRKTIRLLATVQKYNTAPRQQGVLTR